MVLKGLQEMMGQIPQFQVLLDKMVLILQFQVLLVKMVLMVLMDKMAPLVLMVQPH